MTDNLNTCPICEIEEATKKNVHVIPWFLIKNCITKDGTGTREMELSFTISSDNFTKVFPGRGILPETLEEFGEIDDLQQEKTNPYSRDNLLCPFCEHNLGRLEAIFASQFSNQRLDNPLAGDENVLSQLVLRNRTYNKDLYDLLVQSIFYRCSIGMFDGFKLNAVLAKKIQTNLKLAFRDPNFKSIKPNSEFVLNSKFPIASFVLSAPEGKDPTENFIVLNDSRIPYFLLAGRWAFQLFEKESHLRASSQWLYGLAKISPVTEFYPLVAKYSHAIRLNETDSLRITENIARFWAKERKLGLRKSIRQFYYHLFKVNPTPFITEYILRQYFEHWLGGKTELKSFVHAFNDLKKLD